jgi:hypothetical protein
MRYYFILIVTLFLGSISSNLVAQVSVINVESQPIWGPTGYDYVENYYLPDIDAYYNVPNHRYYYYNNGSWRNSTYLPFSLINHDYYNSYKVVVNEKEPWRNHKNYKKKYHSNKGRYDQQLIWDSNDEKYFVNKDHPQHQNWLKQQNHDNGKHKRWYKENESKKVQQDNQKKSKDKS